MQLAKQQGPANEVESLKAKLDKLNREASSTMTLLDLIFVAAALFLHPCMQHHCSRREMICAAWVSSKQCFLFWVAKCGSKVIQMSGSWLTMYIYDVLWEASLISIGRCRDAG